MSWLDQFRKRRFEHDLDDELEFDVECRTQHNIQAGMIPAEARRQALLSLGGLDQTKEECRDARSPGSKPWFRTCTMGSADCAPTPASRSLRYSRSLRA